MIIEGFGVRLERLRHDEIELVRQKRNSAEIRQFMDYREEITPEAQEKWFHSVNNKFNNYFLIVANGEKIGLIYGANIDWEKKETGNGGIFIWAEKWKETSVPLAASLMLTEITFLLGLERIYIKVLRDNPGSISYNRNLGYDLLPHQENSYNQRYVLTPKNYYANAERFRHIFVKSFGDVFTLTLDHPEDESEKNISAVYHAQPEIQKRRIKLVTP